MMKQFLQAAAFAALMVTAASGCMAHSKEAVRPDSTTRVPSTQETRAAMKSVAESLSGQPLTDQDLKKLSHDIRKDPEAKSAVESVTRALGQAPSIKYCPVDGQRFSADQTRCPEHGVELLPVGDQ